MIFLPSRVILDEECSVSFGGCRMDDLEAILGDGYGPKSGVKRVCNMCVKERVERIGAVSWYPGRPSVPESTITQRRLLASPQLTMRRLIVCSPSTRLPVRLCAVVCVCRAENLSVGVWSSVLDGRCWRCCWFVLQASEEGGRGGGGGRRR